MLRDFVKFSCPLSCGGKFIIFKHGSFVTIPTQCTPPRADGQGKVVGNKPPHFQDHFPSSLRIRVSFRICRKIDSLFTSTSTSKVLVSCSDLLLSHFQSCFCSLLYKCTQIILLYKCTKNQFSIQVYKKPVYQVYINW